MNAQQRRTLILSRLPLIDSGGPVWLSLPAEAQKRTKSQTKAKRLRGRQPYWRAGYMDVRPDLLHMVKLGMVKRERNGFGSSKRTRFVPTKPFENPKPNPAELIQEIETREHRADEKLERMAGRITAVCDAVDARMGSGWTELPENRQLYSAVVFARAEVS